MYIKIIILSILLIFINCSIFKRNNQLKEGLNLYKGDSIFYPNFDSIDTQIRISKRSAFSNYSKEILILNTKRKKLVSAYLIESCNEELIYYNKISIFSNNNILTNLKFNSIYRLPDQVKVLKKLRKLNSENIVFADGVIYYFTIIRKNSIEKYYYSNPEGYFEFYKNSNDLKKVVNIINILQENFNFREYKLHPCN